MMTLLHSINYLLINDYILSNRTRSPFCLSSPRLWDWLLFSIFGNNLLNFLNRLFTISIRNNFLNLNKTFFFFAQYCVLPISEQQWHETPSFLIINIRRFIYFLANIVAMFICVLCSQYGYYFSPWDCHLTVSDCGFVSTSLRDAYLLAIRAAKDLFLVHIKPPSKNTNFALNEQDFSHSNILLIICT